MARRIVLIKHNSAPAEDRAATWLAEHGYELDIRHPWSGDPLGEPEDDVAGTVVYGGSQPLTERDRYPFLDDEARWIERCMAKDKPVLGLCLGGQLIAHALGAAVGPPGHGQHEFGYYELIPTDAGRSVIPSGLRVLQAHYHTFDIPRGAELLAGTAAYPHQAFRYGARTFAFQFHPEVTIPILRRWQEADWAPWSQPGAQSREQQDELAPICDPIQHAWFCGFLDLLFGAAGTRGSP